ncbi:MAG: hypothetical protein JWM04_1485 [Verrucomicrobiales bacterium]|jgi:hypothetical protein|nr:hypothetical protein [Verrucomicrobiales bacterium]
MSTEIAPSPESIAAEIKRKIPEGGLFAGHSWQISPDPFRIGPEAAIELEKLGRILLVFYKAVNLLYRQSIAGKQPDWVARCLEAGKPDFLVQLQRGLAFKNDIPRVIRPDLLLTDKGFMVSELDSVPGGIGLTSWLNQTYSQFHPDIIGGANGMQAGFKSIFPASGRVLIVVSEEAATYRPEMEYLAAQIDPDRFKVVDSNYTAFQPGDSVYRFFELFDLANVANSSKLLGMAENKEISLTPPPKTIFEEKSLFALFWNRNLHNFWRESLGESYQKKLQALIPYTWLIDPTPLPPQASFPELGLTDWTQLKNLSQKQRDLIIKISGFSENAWGARGVYLGSDLPQAEWSTVVDKAIAGFEKSPHILQRYEKPKTFAASYLDEATGLLKTMQGRVRLCPYYFVEGDHDQMRANLSGALATICPADKKIIHGMKDAILAPTAP